MGETDSPASLLDAHYELPHGNDVMNGNTRSPSIEALITRVPPAYAVVDDFVGSDEEESRLPSPGRLFQADPGVELIALGHILYIAGGATGAEKGCQ